MSKNKRLKKCNHWMQEHISDHFFQQSKKNGLRSRAWFKLDEIQKKDKLFQPNTTIVDLGSSPGSWSKYIHNKIGTNGKIISCDILPMKPIKGVIFLQGNLFEKDFLKQLLQKIGKKKVHTVLSDMAPNMSGINMIDTSKSINLIELALNICKNILATNANFLVKAFQGVGFNDYLKKINSLFVEVKLRKPKASRSRSREVYIVAKGKR